MTGDCHVRFCESLGVRFPGPLTCSPLVRAFRSVSGNRRASLGAITNRRSKRVSSQSMNFRKLGSSDIDVSE